MSELSVRQLVNLLVLLAILVLGYINKDVYLMAGAIGLAHLDLLYEVKKASNES